MFIGVDAVIRHGNLHDAHIFSSHGRLAFCELRAI
jgi:hypothetical protein